ncbi:MAG: GGDEF domain-containing protein [Dokdonella sp.]|nr:GGDEF domain-containing protein [Dokdonella sp.]
MKPAAIGGKHEISDSTLRIVLELVDHIDAMVAYWDINQECVFANEAYREWFGKTREELLGTTLQELLGPLYEKNLPYICGAYEGHKQVFERSITSPDGIVRHSLATYVPRMVAGKVQGIFVHVADVTSLKRLEEELREARATAEHLATHDFLTGLPNRALLSDRLAQAMAVAERKGEMVAVLSLDVDDFKAVNDSFGHPAGDQLLVALASRIVSSLRPSDSASRLGGDEFVILAPDLASPAEVDSIAERILANARAPFRIGEATVVPTVSLGIAMYPVHGATPKDLLEASDSALYRSKALGKNRYSHAVS